jgi:ABC-type phosphonate transport system ATPase subunit
MFSITHLTKYYANLKGVDNLSFELQPGEMIESVFRFLPSSLAITLGFLLHFHLIVQGMIVIVINAPTFNNRVRLERFS